MTEELLQKLKEELVVRKQTIEEHNKKVKRIKELIKDKKIKEFIELLNIEIPDLKQIKKKDDEIISSYYSSYVYKINENETNKIYVYLGTYKYSEDYDIYRATPDIRVDYNSKDANYREYRDIEDTFSKTINIKQCEKFEKENIIINPPTPTRYKEREYYQIQKEFFIKAIKKDQESAKKYILRKYPKLSENNKR